MEMCICRSNICLILMNLKDYTIQRYEDIIIALYVSIILLTHIKIFSKVHHIPAHVPLCLLFSSFCIFTLNSYQELNDLHYLLSMCINSTMKNLIYQN